MPTRVHGLRELVRANSLAEPSLRKEFRLNYRAVAEPVRQTAESLALGTGNIGGSPEWGRMRTGTTTRVLYVAPRQRGVKGRGSGGRRRPNLADLMMDRALQPALDAHESQIAGRVQAMLDHMARRWAR